MNSSPSAYVPVPTYKLEPSIEVALFVTCLVDSFRPSVGFAAVNLLEQTGCKVVIPNEQTCCGQPAYNSGDSHSSKKIALSVIQTFQRFRFVVVPSGSCAGMIKHHFPSLFEEGSELKQQARELAEKTFELTDFVFQREAVLSTSEHAPSIYYHDSCAGLRELNIKQQPRELLKQHSKASTVESRNSEVCCGFGGLFCVKYAEVSNQMVEKKYRTIEASGAEWLVAGDVGCLLNMAGKLSREGSAVRTFHVAEVLANMTDRPGFAEPEKS